MRLALLMSIVVTALLSEDGGAAAAATLVGSRSLDLPFALTAAVAGLWIGDVAIYALARRFGRGLLDRGWTRRLVGASAFARAETWVTSQGAGALFLSRFVPGTRLPSYIAAGLARMTFSRFALTTALSAAVWSAAVIAFGRSIAAVLPGVPRWLVAAALMILVVGGAGVWQRFGTRMIRRISIFLSKLRRWEFWPAWLFYAPVPFMCAWLGLKYRGLSLPTIANPAQRNGGIVGESKIEILRELGRIAPEHVAEAYLVSPGSLPERTRRIRELVESGVLRFPFVMKPDTAQRGEGFRKISSLQQALGYVIEVAAPVTAQSYAEGPCEAGIFYYRYPGEPRGRILAITDKVFPVVVGDGRSTIRELIEADSRARLIAGTYLRRLGSSADRVLPEGDSLRLVEAGNHCQGCIFRDGLRLYSEALRARIDEISQGLPGFFIGRYDVRYTSEEDLRAGRFTIIELNGSASEATSIYDERNSLLSAYRTLYRQWELVYAIGAANRSLGQRPASLRDVWRDWRQYQAQAAFYPMAD